MSDEDEEKMRKAEEIGEKVQRYTDEHRQVLEERDKSPENRQALERALSEWIYLRSNTPEEIYEKTIFVLDRYIREESIDPEDLERAWG